MRRGRHAPSFFLDMKLYTVVIVTFIVVTCNNQHKCCSAGRYKLINITARTFL